MTIAKKTIATIVVQHIFSSLPQYMTLNNMDVLGCSRGTSGDFAFLPTYLCRPHTPKVPGDTLRGKKNTEFLQRASIVVIVFFVIVVYHLCFIVF